MDDLLMELEAGKATSPTDRERRRRLAATVAICGLAFIGVGQLSTGAWFTDSGTSSVQFTTGDVQVTLASDPGNTAGASTAKALLLKNVGNMAPGDTSYQPIEVKNAGSLAMRYAVTGQTLSTPASGGLPLSDVLQYTVYSGVSSANCLAKSVVGGSVVSRSAGMTLPTLEVALLGDKADGAQAGDRPVAVSSSEWLCVKVDLPGASVGNEYANGKADVTLKFYAEQTTNN